MDDLDISANLTPKSQKSHKQISAFQAFTGLAKAGIGTGILFTPFVFKQCGIIPTLMILTIIPTGIYCSYMLLLSVLKDLDNDKLNLIHLVKHVFSDPEEKKKNKLMSILTKTSFLAFNVGGNIAFYILIINSVGLYLKPEEEANNLEWSPSLYQKLLISLLIIFPIYYPFNIQPKLADLHCFNTIGLLLNNLTFAVLALNCIYLLMTDQEIEIENQKENSQTNEIQKSHSLMLYILINYGIVMYLYDINGVMSDIRGQMKNTQEFKKVLIYYFQFMVAMATVVGLSGYLVYGQDQQANIFVNLEGKGIIKGYAHFLALLYSLSLIISSVLYIYPIVNLLDQTFHLTNNYLVFFDENSQQQKQKLTQQSIQMQEMGKSSEIINNKVTQITVNQPKQNANQDQQIQNQNQRLSLQQHMIRLGVFSFKIFMACVLPRVEVVVSILGSIFSISLGFVIPFLIYQEYYKKNPQKQKPYTNKYAFGTLSFGIVGGILGLCSVFISL
ncbi:hypothetical protein PPERSA_04328 [Pseudocohnilembus persalinus]|uniref:Amino acid transporter transmembrane domain-containing protein n=1 Tax=Pseudocohnilembus persalinus TaxID=266149 RepID=A0A0V0QQN2_PSEPJ|nr:hypothetical protein PPERSA_04328 [Pseudocohnilembus persalinus]|eukprot:KRX04513.1 hypothetical protein PPERSA_04328 [Pseudocohnilembus persalinus]